MKPSCNFLFHACDNFILFAASFLVPAPQRAEWRREWQAELFQVRRTFLDSDSFSFPAQREITAFCAGSFQDALCVRHLSSRPLLSRANLDGSAPQCLAFLAVVLAFVVAFARILPSVSAERDSARYQVNPGLILIQAGQTGDNLAPTISSDLFRAWKTSRQRYFDRFAFYRTVRETASLSTARSVRWRVTHASSNLFSLLGLKIDFPAAAGDEDQQTPRVILSHEVWTRDFASDPRIAGRVIQFGHQSAKIAGVMPYGTWRLPGHPDAWLLESDSQLAPRVGPAPVGYLIAHLTPLGESESFSERIPIGAHDVDGSDLDLYGISFANRLQSPWGIYQFALFLALLALPAVTSVTLGESNYSSHRPSFKRTVFRWTFLASKLLLVAAIAYFASVDLAYWHTSTYSPLAEFVQLVACFSLCLFGFRWALSDQRQRCPVCLHRVTYPARVGVASRTFLGWNGTEMMCMGGHTLLHVPSLPTSWFSGQRWLYLDNSWDFLFADSGIC